MRKTSSTRSASLDIAAPRGWRHHELVILRNDLAAERFENAPGVSRRDVEPAQHAHALRAEGIGPVPGRHLARDRDIARLAAAELANEPGHDLDAGAREFGIEPALEAVARIALKPKLPPGRGSAHGIEERRLDI